MVCFVILHYMALDETIQCVESIRGNIDGEKRIVVVDNCSPNGTVKELEERYRETEEVKVLETGQTSDLREEIISAISMRLNIMRPTLSSS